MKRMLDIAISSFALVLLSPLLIPVMILIYREDKHHPFYVAPRVGKDGFIFKMIKFRSMVVNADRTGVDSTSANDSRITPVGQFIRRYKLDELPQLFNVLKGDMSLVGPRPNVKRETDLYSNEERRLLSVRPGITDFASIVFSDEGTILQNSADPDIDYNQLIRPWKSRFGLFYIDNQATWLDLMLLSLTAVAIISKKTALSWLVNLIESLNADSALIRIARREEKLQPTPPPGMTHIITSRLVTE